MSEFIPSGYISVDDALEHIGRETFPSEWTGQERRARTGLIGIDEWLRSKDLAPARGSGAPDGAPSRKSATRPNAKSPHSTGDPSSDSYQIEYRAGLRYEAARDAFAFCWKVVIAKPPSWILLLGKCIEPPRPCGVNRTPTG